MLKVLRGSEAVNALLKLCRVQSVTGLSAEVNAECFTWNIAREPRTPDQKRKARRSTWNIGPVLSQAGGRVSGGRALV